jgi:hypothetical protein
MKKIFTMIAAAALIALTGCTVKEAQPAPTAGSEPVGQKVTAYYYASYMDEETAKTKLEEAGFDIVATYPSTKESTTIIITNDALKAVAAKPGCGFAAILRVLVDNTHHRLAVTNPVYFEKAFLQKQYDHSLALDLTKALSSALGNLVPSPDVYDYDELPEFHFMIGMPSYADQYVLGNGTSEQLLEKLQSYDGGKDVVFTLRLGEGEWLAGFDLSTRTKRFLDKTGTRNAEVLPYTILIENGHATALKVEYYIALSYPLLSMIEFMNIATLPGQVEKELKKPFE